METERLSDDTEECYDKYTLQNKLQGSMRPLWLLEPGPWRGAS